MLHLPSRLGRLFALSCILVPLSGQAGDVVYPFYVQPELNDLAEPASPLAGEVAFEVLNFHGQGIFDPHTITLKGGQGALRRQLPSVRESTLNRFAGDTDTDLCAQMTMGAPHQQVDQLALNQMAGRDSYITPRQFEQFAESSRHLHPDQMVYLQSVSWHSPAELRQSFGGQIPWERVIAVQAGEALSREQLREAVEAGAPGVRVKLRRTVMRIVASSSLSRHHPLLDHYYLPWEREPSLSSGYVRQRDRFIQSFELGRAAQARVFQGEAMDLARVAMIVALHYSWAMNAYPGFELPTGGIEIVAHSLSDARSAVFKRSLGLEEHPRIPWQTAEPGATLLSSTLDKVLERSQPSRALRSLQEIKDAFGGLVTDEMAAGVLMTYRVISHMQVDFSTPEYDLALYGPVVMRNYSPLRDYAMRMVLRNGSRSIAPAVVNRVMKALHRAGVPRTPRPFAQYDEDLGEQDWARLGLSPNVITNLKDEWLERDPNSLKKLLLTYYERVFLSGKVVPGLWDKVTVAVAVPEGSAMDQELNKLRLRTIAIQGGVAHLMQARDFAELWRANPSIVAQLPYVGFDPRGQWYRRHMLSALPGL